MAERNPPVGGRPQPFAIRTSAPLQLAQMPDDGHVGSASLRAEAQRACYCAHSEKFGSSRASQVHGRILNSRHDPKFGFLQLINTFTDNRLLRNAKRLRHL